MIDKKGKNKEMVGKLQAIKTAMEQIEKQYGKGSIMRLGDRQEKLKVDVISTGCLPLDVALGVGGIPRGRITEIFGPEASGKTTVCLHVIAEAQKAGGAVAFVDAEHALDPERAKSIGVDLDNLLISQPDSGEQALEITETLIRSGAVDVIVVDSVAALVPKSELEGNMGDASMGVQARLMSQALRKLTAVISKSKTALMFTNQMRQKIGVFFGNPETTPGGLALKFYSSIRIDLRRTGNIKNADGVIVGSTHRAKIVKNKVASPFKEAEFEIMNVGGVSKAGGLIDTGVEYGVISKSGAFLKFGSVALGQGKEAAKETLGGNSKLAKDVEKAIWDKVKSASLSP